MKTLVHKSSEIKNAAEATGSTPVLTMARLGLLCWGLAAMLTSCHESSRRAPTENHGAQTLASTPVDHLSVGGKTYHQGDAIEVSAEAIQVSLQSPGGEGLDGLVVMSEVIADGVSLAGCRGLHQCLQAGIDISSARPLVMIVNPKAFGRELRVWVSSAGRSFSFTVRRSMANDIVTAATSTRGPTEKPVPDYSSGYEVGYAAGLASGSIVSGEGHTQDYQKGYAEGYVVAHQLVVDEAAAHDSVSFSFERASFMPQSSTMTRATFHLHASGLVSMAPELCYVDQYTPTHPTSINSNELYFETFRRCLTDDDHPITVERLPDPLAADDLSSHDWLISVPMKRLQSYKTFGARPYLTKGSVLIAGPSPTTNKFPIRSANGAHQITVCGEHDFNARIQDLRTADDVSVYGFMGRFKRSLYSDGAGVLLTSGAFCVGNLCREALDLNADGLIAETYWKNPGFGLESQAAFEAQFCFHKPDQSLGDIVAIDSKNQLRRVAAYAISPARGSWAQNAGACSLLNSGEYAKDLLPENSHWEMINFSSLTENQNPTLTGKEAGGTRLQSLSFLNEWSSSNMIEPNGDTFLNFHAAGFPGASSLNVRNITAHRAVDHRFFAALSSSMAPTSSPSDLPAISPANRLLNGYEAGDISLQSVVQDGTKDSVRSGLCVALRGSSVGPQGVLTRGVIGTQEPFKSAVPVGGTLNMILTQESISAQMDTVKLYTDSSCLNVETSAVTSIPTGGLPASATVAVVPTINGQRYYAKTDDDGAICKYVTRVFLFTPCQTAQSVISTIQSGAGECVRDSFGYQEDLGRVRPSPVDEEADLRQPGHHTQSLFVGQKMTYDDAVEFCWNSTAMGYGDWSLQGGLNASDMRSPAEAQTHEESVPDVLFFDPSGHMIFVTEHKIYSESTSSPEVLTNNAPDLIGAITPFQGSFLTAFSDSVRDHSVGAPLQTLHAPIMALKTDADGNAYAFTSERIFSRKEDEARFADQPIYSFSGPIPQSPPITPLTLGGIGGLMFADDYAGKKHLIWISATIAQNDELLSGTTDCQLSGLAASVHGDAVGAVLFSTIRPCVWDGVTIDQLGLITLAPAGSGLVQNVTSPSQASDLLAPASPYIADRHLLAIGDVFYFEGLSPGPQSGAPLTAQIFKISPSINMDISVVSAVPGLSLPTRPVLAAVGGQLVSAGSLREVGASVFDDYFGSIVLDDNGLGAQVWRHRVRIGFDNHFMTDMSGFADSFGIYRPHNLFGIGVTLFPDVLSEGITVGSIPMKDASFRGLTTGPNGLTTIPGAWISRNGGTPADAAHLSLPIFLNGDRMEGRSMVPASMFNDRLGEDTQTVICVRQKNVMAYWGSTFGARSPIYPIVTLEE